MEDARYCNTLHGFQASQGGLVICMYSDRIYEPLFVRRIRELSGSTTLRHDDWIGHPYLWIDKKEKRLIPAVINAALEVLSTTTLGVGAPSMDDKLYVCTLKYPGVITETSYCSYTVTEEGHVFVGQISDDWTDDDRRTYVRNHIPSGVTLQTKARPTYRVGQTFSIHESEMIIIKAHRELWETFQKLHGEERAASTMAGCHFTPPVYMRRDRWRSIEGQQYADELSAKLPSLTTDEFVTAPFEFAEEWFLSKEADIEDPAIDWPLIDSDALYRYNAKRNIVMESQEK